LAQAIDDMEGLICQSGGRSRQTQHAILRMEGTWAAKRDVRASKAAEGQGGLAATSHTEMFWSARSGGAGEPSGALWRSRGRPPCPMDGPDAQTTSRARYRGGEGVKFYGDSLYFRASLGELCTLCVALGED